jgi:hypothetical protein
MVQILEEPGSNPYLENHHKIFKMSDWIRGSLKKEEPDNTGIYL